MKPLTPFALIVIALGLFIWMDDAPPEADLVFVNQSEVFTLDPQRMSYIQDLRLAHALYEGLVRWDNRDFSIVPAAAEALPEVSADGRRYTFRIRQEAKWSNGEPVTAHDFIYSWQRAMLPDTAADYSHMFFVIEGAEELFAWRAEQTAGFVADPWEDAGEEQGRTTRLATGRLRRLLAAEDLPREVHMPAEGKRGEIAAELSALEAAADGGAARLETELGSAEQTREWVSRLGQRESRAAEAMWMWQQTEARFARTVGLKALDDKTLEVRLKLPTAYFPDLLCFGVFHPVHRPTVEGWPMAGPMPAGGWHAVAPPGFGDRRWVRLSAASGKLEQKHEWAKPGRHVGNGAYVLADWRYKRHLRLEKNRRYHDAERVRSRSILALTIEDTNTAVLAFESGQVDWLASVNAEYQSDMIAQRRAYERRYAEELKRLKEGGLSAEAALAMLPEPERGERRNIHAFPTFGTDFYSFNCRRRLSDGRVNPFANAGVRRAFAMSVNKRAIVERVTQLNEPVVSTLIPPGSIPGYHSPEGLAFDTNGARGELKLAGWEDRDGDGLIEDGQGSPFPVIDLVYTTNTPRYKWMSLELKAQWERQLGVRIELRGSETKFFKEDLKQGRFMIARGNWYGDYGDPSTFLEICRSTDGNNDRKYASARVDRMLEEAARQRDTEHRMEILEECERYLFEEEVPLAPICQLVQVYMYEPGEVTGLSDHPRLTQFLWQMQVKRP